MLSGIETTIEFQMSLLLFMALLGYQIASRINQSVVVGEILVGLVIGPSLLNMMTYSNYVEGMAHLGAVILMFVVGLEFKPSSIYKWKYFIIALAGVILPWIGGYLLAQLFLYDFKTSVFIGTALTATSIAITANVLKEMGKLKTKVAEAIIGAAVIDDVLGLMVLAVSNQVVQGNLSLIDDVLIVLKAVLFMVGGAYIGQNVIVKYLERMDSQPMAKKYPEMLFIFAMMIAFLYSLLAEMIGLSAIVGAFLAGVSIAGVKLTHSKDLHVGSEYMHIIFSSIFFISLGILVDLHQVQPSLLLFTAALTATAIITKVVGCFAASRLQGIDSGESLIIGFGMSPRGEVAMIVGLIGLTSNIITQEVYVVIIFMSLITTVITPLILRSWLSPGG
ncbi:MAG: cation:proton antiporter [Candidatus Altiarchaeota archaeon]